MKALCLILLTALSAAAESNPSWWNFASPEATALVGIQWENLRQSAFADVVGAELFSSGGLDFPDLACLRDARQVLISSPDLLAMASGNFGPEVLRQQAAASGWKLARYRGIELWISSDKAALSVAQMSSQLLLIGMRKTLEDAIDRDQSETGRHYSPLLARAARFTQQDLWVVSDRLPDTLASLFIPLEVEARGFEGSVSVRDGLRLEAALDAGSEQAAVEIADSIVQSIPGLPAVAGGLQVGIAADRVILSLTVTREQFTASLRQTPGVAPPPPPPPEPPKPAGPQIIRILGLDDGPREIVLPPPGEPF